ncbi:MAG: orotidine-5'-phosphate decarboxylase [Puniceicoccales bacterium]
MSNHPSTSQKPSCDIIVALDVPTQEEATHILDRLDGRPQCVKIGLQLFTRYGPGLVETIAARGNTVFLDLKLHDIPNTVAHAIESLAHLPIELLTIHGVGGPAMIRAAAEARDRSGSSMKILAVTILTSMDEEQMSAVGLQGTPKEGAKRLAEMALSSGADGIVCSAHEVETMREAFGSEPILVVPGIRPSGFAKGDQKRVMTPAEAARAGSSHLVIGRPIVKAEDPVAVYDQITEEILSTAQ